MRTKFNLGITIDGNGATPATGIIGDLIVPMNCTINAVYLLADTDGDIVVDIWKDTYANFPPTDADSITSATPPTLSSAKKYNDTTMTGWIRRLLEGDILRFNIDSIATLTRCSIIIECYKG